MQLVLVKVYIYIYIYIYIQKITMCPHGYHHSGSIAQAVSEISKGLQCALTAIIIVALYIYIYIYIYIKNTLLVIADIIVHICARKKNPSCFIIDDGK